MLEWDRDLGFVLHKWGRADDVARQESVTKLVQCVRRDRSAEGYHFLPSSIYLLRGSSLAAAVIEKPQAPAFDITFRSLFPSTRLHQQACQGHVLCLCSSRLLGQALLLLQLKPKDKTPIEANENMGKPTSHMVPVNHVFKKHLIYFYSDHVFGIKIETSKS